MNFRTIQLLFFILALCAASVAEGISEPIDIVYLWVDGSDLKWREIKNHYKDLEFSNGKVIHDAVTENRFLNNGELKYALRSVWKYAPFINHIYIVTMGQRPEWLAEHPMVSIVDHKDIFLNPENLPTFNSQAIESNIHRIQGLSEYFLYSNDDMFFGRPVEAHDFYTEDKKVKILYAKTMSPSGLSSGHLNACCQAAINTNDLLDRNYKRERRHFFAHAPVPLIKSYFYETEETFPLAFKSTSSHRFRSPLDYTITNGLLHYHWLYNGKCAKSSLTNVMVHITSSSYEKTKRRLEKYVGKDKHTFCLQDNMRGDRKEAVTAMLEFLEENYPEKAPWEI